MAAKNIEHSLIGVASTLLALCWLLPNKSDPWRGFHSEFLAATAIGIFAMIAVIRGRSDYQFEWIEYLILSLFPIPFFHFFIGMVPFSGLAWISSAYIFAFLLALKVGAEWGRQNSLQVGDCIFSSILIAAIASVGLQMQQWLGTVQDVALDVWITARASSRPSANMGQPNHLATLLLWAIIGAWWWKWRGFIGEKTLFLVTVFFSFGLALTQSRSGILGYGLLLTLLLFWPPLQKAWKTKKYACAYAGQMVFSALFSFCIVGVATDYLALSKSSDMMERAVSDVRPMAWRMFFDAIAAKPWFGFGWNSAISAQLLEAEKNEPLRVAFFYSHNFFLDIILWIGAPLGLIVIAVLIRWLWGLFKKSETPFHVFGISMAGVTGIHAMVEYPLYYAYFLLPLGVVLGALNSTVLQKKPMRSILKFGKREAILILLLSFFGLFAIARDYLRVESMNISLQLEDAGIRKTGSSVLQDLWILNQFREEYRFRGFEPKINMTIKEILLAENVLKITPSPKNFVTMAEIYQLNKNPEKAKKTLTVMCKVVAREQCKFAAEKWEFFQQKNPELPRVEWIPEK